MAPLVGSILSLVFLVAIDNSISGASAFSQVPSINSTPRSAHSPLSSVALGLSAGSQGMTNQVICPLLETPEDPDCIFEAAMG